MSNIIKFNEKNELLIYEKNGRVLLINKYAGKGHIMISKEVYKYIKKAEENLLEKKDFISCFINKDDQAYIKQILELMQEKEILVKSKNKSNLNKEKDVYFEITDRCNLQCKHCVSNCGPNKNDYLDYKKITNIIENLKLININRLVTTGGEPMIRKDFYKIINYIKENNLNVKRLILSTNGTLIKDNNIKFLKNNFNSIEISIDGFDEESCSLIRGKGVFTTVINNIKLLQNESFKDISLSMCFGEKNYKSLEKFRKLNREMGTTSIERYFIPKGRGLENKNLFYEQDVTLPILIPLYKRENLENSKKVNAISSFRCNAVKEQIFIDYKGDIYPCPSLVDNKYKIGNAMDRKIIKKIQSNDIYDRDGFKNLEKLYPFNKEKCKECDINIFCIKCPAIADMLNDEKSIETWCKLNYEIIDKIIWEMK